MASEISSLAAGSALSRYAWMDRSTRYYDDLKRLLRMHVEPGRRVLEVGFGVGPLLAACAPAQGFGLDISEEVAAEASLRFPQFSIAVWKGEAPLPEPVLIAFPDGVDVIVLANCIGTWRDIQAALVYLKPLCNADTRIIATFYNFLWAPIFNLAVRARLKMPMADSNWLTTVDVRNLFRISGYRVVKSGPRCLLPRHVLGPVTAWINRYLTCLPGFRTLAATRFVVARAATTYDRSQLTVSVVIPARNERGNIEPALRRLAEVAKSNPEKYEVIFVEGGSSDGTAAEIQRVVGDPDIEKPFCAVQVHAQTGKGKGDAVRKGFANATGDLLMILDADLTVPPEDLPKFVATYAQGHGEFLNGSRLVYNMEKEAMRPLNLIGNKFFSWAFTWLLDQRFKDTLCGTKLLSRKNYERIVRGRAYFGDFDPFGDFDLIFGASKLDLEITEVPIRYRDRSYGATNINRWQHGWLLLRMCVFALRKIKFVP